MVCQNRNTCGPIIAGRTTSNFDIWGDSVNIASRLESSGEIMKVQISEQVKKLLPLGIDVSKKQTTSLKGKGELNTYFIIND